MCVKLELTREFNDASTLQIIIDGSATSCWALAASS
jgi:hypothetical protein